MKTLKFDVRANEFGDFNEFREGKKKVHFCCFSVKKTRFLVQIKAGGIFYIIKSRVLRNKA